MMQARDLTPPAAAAAAAAAAWPFLASRGKWWRFLGDTSLLGDEGEEEALREALVVEGSAVLLLDTWQTEGTLGYFI